MSYESKICKKIKPQNLERPCGFYPLVSAVQTAITL